MREIEEKTGLIRRFEDNRRGLENLRKTLRRIEELSTGEAGNLAARAGAEIETLIVRG